MAPVTAEARLNAVNDRREAIVDRRRAARADVERLTAVVEEARRDYRRALATAATADRRALDAAAAALAQAQDVIAGCDQALADLEPEWGAARIACLHEQAAIVQARIDEAVALERELGAQIDALQVERGKRLFAVAEERRELARITARRDDLRRQQRPASAARTPEEAERLRKQLRRIETEELAAQQGPAGAHLPSGLEA